MSKTETPAGKSWLSARTLGLHIGAALLALVGCDRQVSSDKTSTTSSEGTGKTKEKTGTQSADGTVTKTEESKKTTPAEKP